MADGKFGINVPYQLFKPKSFYMVHFFSLRNRKKKIKV